MKEEFHTALESGLHIYWLERSYDWKNEGFRIQAM